MGLQRKVCLALVSWIWLVPGVAWAESFRCANGIASDGDSKAAVLGKCGEPVVQHSFCRTAAPPTEAAAQEPGPAVTVNVLPCITVDEWTFNPGKGKFLTTLRFHDGELASIEQGDRIPD